MFDFSNYSSKWKYYDNPNNLVIGQMKDDEIKRICRLKAKDVFVPGRW